MVQTGIHLDFITVDGSEGGTGAAPVEFTDHLGSPLRDAIVFVDNALIGAGLRDHVKAAVGKIVSAYDLVGLCYRADWCNMFGLHVFNRMYSSPRLCIRALSHRCGNNGP